MKPVTTILLLSLIAFLSCDKSNHPNSPLKNLTAPAATKAVKPDPRPSSKPMPALVEKTTTFFGPGNVSYKATEVLADFPAEANGDSRSFNPGDFEKPDCGTDVLIATTRREAKTTFVNAAPESFSSLTSFLKTLPFDEDMLADPTITKDPNNTRHKAENRRIQLKDVFIKAIKRDADNSYSIILTDKEGNFFNAINSGIPANASRDKVVLAAARKLFEKFFGEYCSSNYTIYEPAIPIEVEGSLFYNIDHLPGSTGPRGQQCKTSWEIRPVMFIKFR